MSEENKENPVDKLVEKMQEEGYPVPQPYELTLKEVEVHKLNLQPGDVLSVVVKNDDMDFSDLNSLRKMFGKIWPNNQIFLLNLGTTGDIKFSIVSQPQTGYSCGDSQSPGYCSDCDCGKKERVEAQKKEQE